MATYTQCVEFFLRRGDVYTDLKQPFVTLHPLTSIGKKPVRNSRQKVVLISQSFLQHLVSTVVGNPGRPGFVGTATQAV